ncbi:hypothetical protein [Deinococcus hopiensis]|uniref:Uncharacterized protein n=1 Tax=Deinococcus hopiensis KR-140 TaxID=695939 RepID=A0A1W1UXB2_9DEIO|nr:hypothetical protein [Deinococcus hopiensis]SMB85733.1 hypothetical protein SAMN00790413_03519 [Deinococcus hopiensis KR-140]
MALDPVIVTGGLSLAGTVLVAWLGFLNARLSSAKTSEQALIDRLEKRIDQLDKTIANQDRKLALLEQKNDALEKENDSLKERVRVLEKDGAAAEHHNLRLAATIQQLQQEKDALNRENGELHSQLAAVATCGTQGCQMRDMARQLADGGTV